MLVLTRKLNQAIWIGPDIRVSVVRINSDQIRVGIEAPQEIRVLREELKPPGGGEPEVPGATKGGPR